MRVQGGRRTTTATSRSRTCRRCDRSRPGSTRSAPPCRSCRPPVAPRYRRGPWPVAVRRRRLTAEPAASRLFEGGPGGRSGRSRPRRSPTGSPASRCGWPSRRWRRAPRPAPAIDPAQLARLVAPRRGRRAVGHERQGGVGGARARRRRPVDAARRAPGLRQITDAAALAAARRRRPRPPTRRRSPNCGPARRRCSASSSARSWPPAAARRTRRPCGQLLERRLAGGD